MKSKSALLLPLLSVVALSVGYWIWMSIEQDRGFECGARMHTKHIADASNKSSAVDVFLSLHVDGKGYLLISGAYSSPKTPLVNLDSLVNFTYRRDGGYYSLHLGQRSPAVIELFDVLKANDLKIKFTHLDSNDYIVSSPIETLMLCTVD